MSPVPMPVAYTLSSSKAISAVHSKSTQLLPSQRSFLHQEPQIFVSAFLCPNLSWLLLYGFAPA
eukprot:457316-Amphidinium_carterae.1